MDMRATGLLLLCCLIRYVQHTLAAGKCSITKERLRYDFVIGILCPTAGVSPLQEWVDKNSGSSTCFNTPHFVNLRVQDRLQIPRDGWTEIQAGIDDAVGQQANTKRDVGLSVVIGPFYMNLAMILEDIGIPYVVTDYMGFDWSDISRVDDHVRWNTMLEVRPPMADFNRAVVDFLVMKGWESAVMIMPENPKENQECHNLARQMVEHNISPIAYSLRVTSQHMKASTKDVLRNVKLLQQKRIIICSPKDETHNLIQIVLDEASLFNMLSDPDYSFFILDPTTHLKALSEINMYRKGLFAANCDLYAYRYRDINDTQPFDSAYAFGALDAAHIIYQAKYWYPNTRLPNEPGIAKTDDFSKERFLHALKNVHITDAETGEIIFNKTGSRVNYTLSLYNHGGIDLYQKVGSWASDGESPDQRLTFLELNETDEKETRGIFKDVEKVVVVLEEPFVILRSAPKGVTYHGNERYDGFTIDLISRISDDLQFQYEIVISPGNSYGQPDSKGVWGGIVGEIMAGNATLGMGALSITSQRETVIDFSLGVVSTGVNILVKKPAEIFNIFQFLQPFSFELWMAILGSSAGVSVLYYILDFKNKERVFTVRSTLWFSVGTLLMKGSDFSPRATSQRILTSGFLFFVLITVSTYTANMAAFLTKKNLEEPLESFEQLADRSKINVLTVDDSATMNFLKNSIEGTVYHRLWEKVVRGNGLVSNASAGRSLVEKGQHAFIFDSLINSFSEKKYCDTRSVSAPILLQEHGIAMYAGAPFKSQLNIALLRLKEEGFIQELKKKWWENARECGIDYGDRTSTQVAFDLQHTAGVFIVGSFGLGSSLAFFIFKKLFVLAQGGNPFKRKKANDSNSANSNHSNSEEKSKDPLIYGVTEGKQSTV